MLTKDPNVLTWYPSSHMSIIPLGVVPGLDGRQVAWVDIAFLQKERHDIHMEQQRFPGSFRVFTEPDLGLRV